MLKQRLSTSIWSIVLSLFLNSVCGAEEKPAGNTTALTVTIKEWEHPTFVLSSLQKAHGQDANTFVVEAELDCLIRKGGGGACASAVTIDLLQTLRIMAGLEKLSNPHKAVLESFADQKKLLKGRVSNKQLVKLIEFYQPKLDGAKVTVAVESAPGSSQSIDSPIWSKSRGPELAIKPRQIKILSYTVTEGDGKVLGRHFVLLKEVRKNEVVVVDPIKPMTDRRYILDIKAGNGLACEHLFLLQPPGAPARTRVYELNTVLTVSLSGDVAGAGPPSGIGASVEYVKKQIDQTAAELRGTDNFLSPRTWREKSAVYGLPGLDLPREYGGSDWPAAKMLDIFRHAGKHNLNFRDVVGGAHVRPLLNSESGEVLDIVRQVASGKGYIAIAITEPDAGSDIPSIKSSSQKVKGGYLLTGTKRFNARLDQATHVILFTQGTTGKPGQLSVFVVPIDDPGLAIERFPAHGLTGNSYGGVSFRNLFVPENRLIGKDGEGLRIFFEHFLYWRLMQTAAAIGTAEDALSQMAERIKTREAFGGPIGRFTHLQQPIGQYTTELKMAYALAQHAAELIDQGDYKTARPLICGLKAEGVENAIQAVDAAARAFGGAGYSNLVDLGDRLRDLNGLRIADGTTDVMRMEVVRHTFGSEFWEMAIQRKK